MHDCKEGLENIYTKPIDTARERQVAMQTGQNKKRAVLFFCGPSPEAKANAAVLVSLAWFRIPAPSVSQVHGKLGLQGSSMLQVQELNMLGWRPSEQPSLKISHHCFLGYSRMHVVRSKVHSQSHGVCYPLPVINKRQFDAPMSNYDRY